MKRTPSQYREPKIARFAYQAGYGNGYSGKISKPEIRGSDAKDVYTAGYADGAADRQKRIEETLTKEKP